MTTDTLRRQADPLPGRLDRRARGQRDGQRPRDAAGARASALSVSLVLEEGLDADELRGRGRGDRRGGRRPRGSRSSPATPRSSSAATPTRCTSARPGSAASTSARRSRPARSAAGDRVLVSEPIGEHGTAIMLARDEFDLDADDRLRHALAVAGRGRPARRPRARAALHARRDPRWRRVGAQRACARVGRRRSVVREARRPGARPRSPAPRRCSGSTRCTSRTRA